MAQYDTRLGTRTSADVDRRLRLAAVVSRRTVADLVTDALDRTLPSTSELVAQLGVSPDRALEAAS